MDKYGYIGIETLLNFCENSKDHSVTPNDFMRMKRVRMPERKKGKWIPCSDVPDTDRNVFIARGEQGNMTVCIGHYSNEYKQWYEDKNWFGMLLYDGLYWCEMPQLPEPYREEGEQK